MSVETIIIYSIGFLLLTISWVKDKQKTKIALKKGYKKFMNILPVLLPLFLLVGIILTVITPSFITTILGDESGFLGYVISLLLGSITFMSPFIAYPLGAELLENGAAYPQIAGFLVTLMSVGLIYFAMETKYFNKKAAIYRNVISFIGAVVVVFVVLVLQSW